MQPNKEFIGLPKQFWANVRTLSQEIGYTERPKRQPGVKGPAGPIKIPALAEMKAALDAINLSSKHIVGDNAKATDLGRQIIRYFDYRADALNRVVEPLLMDADRARALYEQ